MELRRLELNNFRNYEALDVTFDGGVNLILGDNAQGKTNLLEGISLLSGTRSWWARREQELIRFGAEFAELRGEIYSQEREQELKIQLFADRRPRRVFVSGVKQRSGAELGGRLTSVLFCPEDLSILKEGSALRRRFLDAPVRSAGRAGRILLSRRRFEGKARLHHLHIQSGKHRLLGI